MKNANKQLIRYSKSSQTSFQGIRIENNGINYPTICFLISSAQLIISISVSCKLIAGACHLIPLSSGGLHLQGNVEFQRSSREQGGGQSSPKKSKSLK